MTGADARARHVIVSRIVHHEIADRAPPESDRGMFMGLGQASPQDKPAL